MELCMDKKSELGKFIMAIFEKFIESQNDKQCKGKDYKEIKKFKPQKATQAKLAEILNNNTSNISAYLNGEIKIQMEMIFNIAEKLEVTSEDFLKLAKLFAMQETSFLIESDSKDMPAINKINQSFIDSITAKLLFEFYKTKTPSYLKKRWGTDSLYKIESLHDEFNSPYYFINNKSNIKIAKLLFDDTAGKKRP